MGESGLVQAGISVIGPGADTRIDSMSAIISITILIEKRTFYELPQQNEAGHDR
jgi:hypothetical protein